MRRRERAHDSIILARECEPGRKRRKPESRGSWPGVKLLATLRTLNPLKIYPLDQIRGDRGSALRARLIEQSQHFLPGDFS